METTKPEPCSRAAAILLDGKELLDIIVYKYDTGDGVLVLLGEVCQPELWARIGTNKISHLMKRYSVTHFIKSCKSDPYYYLQNQFREDNGIRCEECLKLEGGSVLTTRENLVSVFSTHTKDFRQFIVNSILYQTKGDIKKTLDQLIDLVDINSALKNFSDYELL